MAHAYTPGLTVTRSAEIVRRRILPLKGRVLVSVGEQVEPDTVVAQTDLPGPVEPMNVANILGTPPEDVPECMLKKQGDRVEEGEVIATSKSFFGLFTSRAKSRISGTIESVSGITGQVLLRGKPIPVQVKAYIKGEVVEVVENEGVVVKCHGSLIQGIFGIGGETHGTLKLVCSSRSEMLDEKRIDESCAGCIVVGGSLVTSGAIRRAIEVEAAGIISGGMNDKDLRDFLGYDLGVAITGSEEKGITIMLTEGFGEIDMAERTFSMLKSLEGKSASMNGATQIRAGVIRPEAIVPVEKQAAEEPAVKHGAVGSGLSIGSPVRVIREPHFGSLGKVIGLPPELAVLDSESKARVVDLELAGGEKVRVPRANVELIEG